METTGLFFEYFDEPTEIGAVKLDINLNIVDKLHLYVLPKKKITPKISELTGLTEEFIKTKPYVNTKEGITQLRNFIGNSIPVGHNARFDITFTNYWLNKFELPLLGSYICTEKTFRYNYRDEFAPSKGRFLTNLTAMGNILGVKNNQAHSAIEDTIATAKCFIEMFHNEDKIAFINLPPETAYADFKSRVFKSKIYSKVIIDITTISPINIPEKISEENRNKIYKLLDTYQSPEEISKSENISLGIVQRAFIDWISPIKLKKIRHLLWTDRRTPKVIEEILEFCNWDLDEAYKFMKMLTPYPPSKIKFEIIKKLFFTGEIPEYSTNDFEEYFINYQPISVIQNVSSLDDTTVIRYLSDWLVLNQEYLKLWIQALDKKYLLTKYEYIRMIEYKKKSEEKYNKWYSELSEENLHRIENTNLFIEKKLLDY